MTERSSLLKLKEIHFSCSAHATEDYEKVKTAFLNLLPLEMRENAAIRSTNIQGYVGNEITLLELSITRKEMKKVIDYLALKMNSYDKESLYQTIEKRIDEENCFYLRFNKQDAYNDLLSIDEGDNTIRIAIKFIIYKDEPDLIITSLLNYRLIIKR